MCSLEKGSVERDRIVREWSILRNDVHRWIWDPANRIAVGDLRYEGLGRVCADVYTVGDSESKRGIDDGLR